jgi:hypothetical protein
VEPKCMYEPFFHVVKLYPASLLMIVNPCTRCLAVLDGLM